MTRYGCQRPLFIGIENNVRLFKNNDEKLRLLTLHKIMEKKVSRFTENEEYLFSFDAKQKNAFLIRFMCCGHFYSVERRKMKNSILPSISCSDRSSLLFFRAIRSRRAKASRWQPWKLALQFYFFSCSFIRCPQRCCTSQCQRLRNGSISYRNDNGIYQNVISFSVTATVCRICFHSNLCINRIWHRLHASTVEHSNKLTSK